MKPVAMVLVMMLSFPYVANAQTGQGSGERRLVKIIVGGSLLVIGAAVVANSGESTTVESAGRETSTSSFSTPQLVTGLAIAGTGGLILWSALRRSDSAPTISVGATAGKTRAVFIRRSW